MQPRMTALEVERVYDDMYRTLQQLRSGTDTTGQSTVATYKSLHTRFVTLTCGDDGGGEVAAAVAHTEAAATAAEDELRQLEEQLQHKSSSSNNNDSAAAAHMTVARAVTHDSPAAAHVRSPFVTFATQLAEVHAQLVLMRQVCRALLKADATALRDERVSAADVRLVSAPTWRAREQQLVRACAQLRRKATALQASTTWSLQQRQQHEQQQQLTSRSLAEVQEMLTEVQDAATAAAEQLRRATAARRVRDAQLATFADECRRLTSWCLQQQANLEAMRDAEHVQEFCATLVANYAVMSQNFAYLRTSVDAYVRGNVAAVRAALRDAHERYVYLQVTALERLAHTLYELHPQSPLEAEAERYADYTTRLATFARAMCAYVRSTAADDVRKSRNNDVEDDDDGKAAVSTTATRTRQAHALLRAADEVATLLQQPPPSASTRATSSTGNTANSMTCAQLPREIRSFAARARALRRAYGSFRDATLCRATFLASVDDVDARAVARQRELDEAVRELKAWANATAHGESWRDVYGKLVELKRTIQREQQAYEKHTTTNK